VTDLRDVVIAKAKDAVKLAGNTTGYNLKANVRGQWQVIVSQTPALAPFKLLYLETAGVR
jgi:hypothetical protein